MSDPYRVLEVPPDATPGQIRAAYLRLAKQHHPDSGSGDAATMAAVNAAWAQLRSVTPTIEQARPSATVDETRGAPPASLPTARIPWRFMAGMAAAGLLLVAVGAATADGTGRPEQPDRIIQPGSCVDLDARQEAVEVLCDGPHDYVVAELVGAEQSCTPPGERYRDTQGLGWVCAVAAD
jgi:hypothetical protein